MKKKYLVLGLAIAVVLVGTIGVAAALRNAKEQSITANISEKDLGVSVIDSSEGKGSTDVTVEPNGNIPLHYCVKNTGGSNGSADGSYDIYAKVDVYYDFTSKDGEAMNWSENYQKDMLTFFSDISDTLSSNKDFDSYDANKIAYGNDYETVQTIGDWIVAYSDETQLTLYYTKPLAYGETTPEFLSYIEFSELMDNDFAESELSIDYEITAVQANSGTDAIAAEWGVFPTIDSNGIITKVSETR